MTQAFTCFATTAKHMESLLAGELHELGCSDVSETRAGAGFTGSLDTAYRVCLWSRVANRVLLVLARFPAATAETLYAGVHAIPWEQHFDTNRTFAVDFSVSQSAITHSHFGALKVKDAIADRFREKCGERPSVRMERPDVQINVYLLRDVATVSLDLSGESLHRRRYREGGVAAPLKETLAAAILLRAGWPVIAGRGGAFVDPMCGSGTLPIEAALMAADVAPGLGRDYWGFLHWKYHDPAAWQSLVEEAEVRRATGIPRLPDIRGYDHDASAVRVALANVQLAGLHGSVHIERRDLEAWGAARPNDTGLVAVNPPYGERLGNTAELPRLYARLGAVLKEQFAGWHAAVFTGNPDLGKTMGLRARRMHTLYNGALECKLLHFEITPQWYVSTRALPRPVTETERGPGGQMFANRLRKNIKLLDRWLRRDDIHCYRLYDADLPEYALAVDVYQGDALWVHVQEYEAPRTVDPRKARQRLREALSVILEVLEIPEAQLFYKVRRRQKGHAQYGQLADTRHFHEVRENGCRFLVNFSDYLDTGLFLDHRITRARLAALAQGRHFLNLFAYTGTASVYAAAGGALSTTTVDMSNIYLEWARRNMALNGFTGSAHAFIQADCTKWLDTAAHRTYGLIFLDPPTFSTSKRMAGTLDVQRDHATLIGRAVTLLADDGVMIFSTNSRRFKLDRQALSSLTLEDLSRATLPKDFERNPRIHQCWKITHSMSGN
jgi:23S rRNA (guanine2445-N2)-methyltransferase / 23S rRNA (guanine2069-N7)-methyltransferase